VVVLVVVELMMQLERWAKLVDLLVVVVVMQLLVLLVLSLHLETNIQELEVHSHHQLMGGEVIATLVLMEEVVVEQEKKGENTLSPGPLGCPHLMLTLVFHQVMEHLDLLLVDGLVVVVVLVLMVQELDLLLEVLAEAVLEV
tara:strand:+ start:22 stop:447 length:426 start_codon:yes stop_codon:yes gene_type:complete